MISNNRLATFAFLLAASMAPPLASAEPGAESTNHGYGGVGLVIATNTLQTPLGDFNSRGGGIAFTGAGVFQAGSGIGIGVTGGMDFGSRTMDDTDETIADFGLGFDGGVVFADIFYVSLGLDFHNFTPESTDITGTYTVVPLGLGILVARDSGYAVAQLRFGGGQLSNDQDNLTEDVDYFGIRVVGQTGTANGLQFMGGMEFDAYGYTSSDITDSFFRLIFGVGFGS